MKRSTQLLLLALFTIIYWQTPLFAQSVVGTGATAMPDHLTLSWTGNPATTQTVTWRTDISVTAGIVEYQAGDRLTEKARRVIASSSDFTTDLGVSRIFSAALTGLRANTKYCYRVGDGQHWSDQHTFVTASPRGKQLKFLVFGDSQSGNARDPNYEPWHITLTRAYLANKDARFIMNVGDLVEQGQNGTHWNAWFDSSKGIIDTIPEMPVQGNHETFGNTSPKPVFWISQFSLPENGPETLKEQVYSFDYGPVHIAVLDSQQNEEGTKFGDILSVQQSWLAADLAATHAIWKIVLFHKPPYPLNNSRMNENVKAAFCPIFDKYHVDLVFNAHDHGIAHSYPLAHDTIVARPSQGTIYYMVGRSGNKSYGGLEQKYWNTFFLNPQDQPNYLVVTIKGKQLTVKAFKQDGTLVDTFIIDKARDVDSDTARTEAMLATAKNLQPSLAIYGNPLNLTQVHHLPLLKDGVWYIDANAFASSLGGNIESTNGVTTISAVGKKVDVAAGDALTDNGTLLISVSALKNFGFTATFHPEIDLLNLMR